MTEPVERHADLIAQQAVDGVRERMASLDGLPTAEHVAVFDQVHRELSAVLSSLDSPSHAG